MVELILLVLVLGPLDEEVGARHDRDHGVPGGRDVGEVPCQLLLDLIAPAAKGFHLHARKGEHAHAAPEAHEFRVKWHR